MSSRNKLKEKKRKEAEKKKKKTETLKKKKKLEAEKKKKKIASEKLKLKMKKQKEKELQTKLKTEETKRKELEKQKEMRRKEVDLQNKLKMMKKKESLLKQKEKKLKKKEDAIKSGKILEKKKNKPKMILSSLLGSVEKVVVETKMNWIDEKNRKLIEQEEFDDSVFDVTNSSEKKIRVVVCSYNVNEKVVENQRDLFFWMQMKFKPIIIAIGLQEVDMSPIAFAKGSSGTSKNDRWKTVLSGLFGYLKKQDGIGYVKIASHQLVGIYGVVFVRKDKISCVKDVRFEKLACGTLGALGNKGGVAIRFQYFYSSLCFITSHLEAHKGHVVKRNQHFKVLEHGINFDGDPRKYNCKNHDALFWFGDLNYRIQLSYEDSKKLASEGKFRHLLAHDQLTLEKIKGECFDDYEEGKITFRPTYKFDPGTNNYDTSEKMRVPSYCDRILFKSKRGKKKCIRCMNYCSFEGFKVSDHKPVSATFEVSVLAPKTPKIKTLSNANPSIDDLQRPRRDDEKAKKNLRGRGMRGRGRGRY